MTDFISFLKTKKGKIIAAAVCVLLLAVIALIVILASNSDKLKGYRNICVTEIVGDVTAGNNGKEYKAYKNLRLSDGYFLATESESYTRMTLDDDKYVKLEEKSRAEFRKVGTAKSKNSNIYLSAGTLTTELTKPLLENESYVVNTPNAVLAVRGTFFRVTAELDENGDYYSNVYTYGGSVACKRIMPDGTVVEENVVVDKGYKACIKMDEVITIYIEELIEEESDNVDPIEIPEIPDGDIVAMYDASRHGHDMFLTTEELWDVITERGIDLSEYSSVYDGGNIPPLDEPAGEAEETVTETETSEETTVPETEETSETSVVTTVPERTEAGGADTAVTNVTSVTSVTGTSRSAPAETSVTSKKETPETASLSPDTSSAGSSESEEKETELSVTEETSFTTAETTTVAAEESLLESEVTVTAPAGSLGGNDLESVSEPHTHTPVTKTIDADCTQNGSIIVTCAECGTLLSQTIIPASGHNMETEAEAEEAKCETDGITELRKCSRCGYTEGGEVIPALGHTEVIDDAVPAKCTEKGLTEGKHCSVCGEIIIAQTETDPLGHTEVIDDAVPAKCTEKGLTEGKHCSVCNEIIIPQTETDPLGHDMQLDTPETEAACETDGKTALYKCARADCDYEEGGEKIDALGHDMQLFADEIPAKPLTEGKTAVYKCRRADCDHEEGGETIAALELDIDSASFPDAALLNYVLSEFDADGNGKLSLDEVKNITSLDLSGKNISSLKGLEYFPNLEELDCSDCKLPYIDISGTSITKLTATGNEYPITPAADGSFAVTNISGINPIKISNVSGADYNADTGLFTNITGDITYTYDCGNGKTAEFKLKVSSHGIAINDTNFPDDVFRTYVSTNFDKEGGAPDGYLSESEIANAKSLTIADSEVNSLEGIEYLTALTELTCRYSGITSLDVSKLTALEKLTCSSNSALTSLTFGNNTALKELDCSLTGITSLDVSKNTALIYLNCRNTNISSLDVSKNIALINLVCFSTNISSLNVSNNTALKQLCCDNTNISSLDVRNNTALTMLACYSTNISSLDVRNNTALTYLSCYSTNISSLDVRNNTALTFLSCDSTNISSLDVSNNTALTYLYCRRTKLAYVDVSKNTSLTDFYASGNEYVIPQNSLRFYAKKITGFDPTKATLVSGAEKFENGIFENISGDVKYTYDCGYGSPVEFTLSRNGPPIEGIPVNETNFPDENFRKIIFKGSDLINSPIDKNLDGYLSDEEINETTIIYASGKEGKWNINTGMTADGVITSLKGIEYFTELETLKCSCNAGLTELDISKNTKLTRLECSFTNLSSLDLSKNEELTYLMFQYTNISELNLNKNTKLETINVYGNHLAFVDVSKTSSLETFVVYDNKHPITLINGEFDLNDIEGFNVDRIVDGTLTGATLNGTVLKISAGTTEVTYQYDCKGTGESKYIETFTLVPDGGGTFSLMLRTLEIDEESFPDPIFRDYISEKFDLDGDGDLSPEEIEAVTVIDVSNKSDLESLDGIWEFPNLKTLYCSGTGITSLCLYGNPNLRYLYCYNCKLPFVDLEGTQVRSLDNAAYGNMYPIPENASIFDTAYIEGFDFERVSDVQNAALNRQTGVFTDIMGNISYKYYCGNGVFAAFTLARTGGTISGLAVNSDNFPDKAFRDYILENFDPDSDGYLSEEEIADIFSVDVSGNYSVASLEGIGYFTELERLDCSNTGITSLNAGENAALTYLNCERTALSSLDVSGNAALEELYCADSGITSLDLRSNTALKILNCSENPIMYLDLSMNGALERLDAEYCMLAYLDLDGNPYLTELNAYGNMRMVTLTFDMFDLSEIRGLNILRIDRSSVRNAELDIMLESFTGITDTVTYVYDCGNGHTAEFALVPANEIILADDVDGDRRENDDDNGAPNISNIDMMNNDEDDDDEDDDSEDDDDPDENGGSEDNSDSGDNEDNSDSGDNGDNSDSGDNGDNSDSGDSGDNSDTGDSGDNSDTGDSGDNSDTGDSGDNSDSGDNEDNSDSGDSGNNSDSGDSGNNSDSGDSGDNSDTGDSGDNSDSGDSGDNSDSGDSGDNSDTGDNSYSS